MSTNLEELSADQLEELSTLMLLKNEADSLYNTVIKYQKVGLIGEKHIIWDDGNNQEYLKKVSDTWVWVASYLNQHYEVAIDASRIFEVMKLGYVFSKNPKNRCRVNSCNDAIKYFSSYVNKLKMENKDA